jgi:hypothetical protein
VSALAQIDPITDRTGNLSFTIEETAAPCSDQASRGIADFQNLSSNHGRRRRIAGSRRFLKASALLVNPDKIDSRTNTVR